MAKLSEIYFGLLSTAAFGGYFLFAYVFPRTAGGFMYMTYILLFVMSIVLTMMAHKKEFSWIYIFAVGLLFRGMFLCTPPHLSDDYFRFSWDGELQQDGISSFAFLPKDYDTFFAEDTLQLKKYEALYEAQSEEFPEGMNSKGYYSIYPTINQLVFKAARLWGGPNEGHLLVMRLLLILAEVASFFILRALLRAKNMALGLVGLYWLNPLVIIEVVGNLHFDGLALAFILLMLYLLERSKYTQAGIALALAVCTKLNPLFLLGGLFRKVSIKTLIWVCSITVITSLLLLSLILNGDTFWNFKSSFGLYFAWFEFNAGLYYLVRELGLLVGGVDLSAIISLVFPVLSVLLFAILLWNPKTDLSERFLLLFFVYFSFSPIVHPWYIIVLIPLTVISRKLYPLLWSLLVFFTYTTYREPFGESLTLVFVEYGLVYGLFYMESYGKCPPLGRLKQWFFLD